jgi:serine protease Do
LKVGDVITQLDGHEVNDAGGLQVEVGQKSPGTTVKLGVVRDGKTLTLPVTLEAMGGHDKEDQSASAENGKPRWGLGLADLTPDIRQQIQAPNDVQGAVIERVQPGSPADDAGLAPGQVIMGVNRHEVQSASDVQKQLSSVPKGQDALVRIWANGGSTFRVMHAANGA